MKKKISFFVSLMLVILAGFYFSPDYIQAGDDDGPPCTGRIYLYGPVGTPGVICGPGGTQVCTIGSSGKCIFFNLCDGTYETCTVNGTNTVVIEKGSYEDSNPNNSNSCICPD